MLTRLLVHLLDKPPDLGLVGLLEQVPQLALLRILQVRDLRLDRVFKPSPIKNPKKTHYLSLCLKFV